LLVILLSGWRLFHMSRSLWRAELV